MTIDTVGDCFARERRSDRPALVDATGREYDRHWLCTSAWKAGNFLRHTGVRRGVAVGVVGDGPLPLLAFFGASLLEGRTRFEPPAECSGIEDLRTLVAPASALDAYDLPPGAQRVGYGDQPDAPDVHHFDAGLWSENPSFPPITFGPETPLLEGPDGRAYTHGDVLEAARSVADDAGIESGTRVVVRGSLADPRVVAAGVIAPLLRDGTIVLAGAVGTASDRDGLAGESDRAANESDVGVRGDVAVTDGGAAPESTIVAAGDVPLA